MRIKSGNIPKEVTYIVAAPRKIAISWEDAELEEGETEKIEEVFSTFVSDAANATTLASGRKWALQQGNVWNPVTGKYEKPTYTVKEITRPNNPITKLRIYGLDVRGNGGRAWKCADESGHYFDLREDVLLDLMRTVGIAEGGYLNGEYIWGKIHAEMRLVRVGSELHAALEKASGLRVMKNIPKKELKLWHLYQQKNSEVFLYLGKTQGFTSNNPKYNRVEDPLAARRAEWARARNEPANSMSQQYYLRKWRTLDEPPRPAPLAVEYTQYERPLWLHIRTWDSAKSTEENLKVLNSKKENIIPLSAGNYYYFTSQLDNDADKKVVSDLGELEIPNVFEQIRQEALRTFFDKKKESEANSYSSDFILKERARVRLVETYLEYGTVTPVGTEMDPSFDFWITEIISKEPK